MTPDAPRMKYCSDTRHMGERCLPIAMFYVAHTYMRQDGGCSVYHQAACRECVKRLDRERKSRQKGHNAEQAARAEHRYQQRRLAKALGTAYCSTCDNPRIPLSQMTTSAKCRDCERHRSRLRRYRLTGKLPSRFKMPAKSLIHTYLLAMTGLTLHAQHALTGLGHTTLWLIRSRRMTHVTPYVKAALLRGMQACAKETGRLMGRTGQSLPLS